MKDILTDLKHSSSSTSARSEGSPTILDIPAAMKESTYIESSSSEKFIQENSSHMQKIMLNSYLQSVVSVSERIHI